MDTDTSFVRVMAGSNILNHVKDDEWINLSANTPFNEEDLLKTSDFSSFFLLNDAELVVARHDWPIKHKISIFKYNAITMKWTNLCTFGLEKADSCTTKATILYDNKLHFFIEDWNHGVAVISVMSLDLSTNQLTTKIDHYQYTNESVYNTLFHPIIVNGFCHLFIHYEDCDRETHHMHLSLSEECGVVSKQYKIITEDDTMNIFPLIYVPHLNSILFFSYNDEHRCSIWRFRVDTKEKEWSKVKGIDLQTWTVSAFIGFDGNCVVMHSAKNIYLLDVSDENDLKLFESDILIPLPYTAGAVKPSLFRMGNGLKIEKLVIGWTKRLFGENEFKHLALPPLYLLQLISHWVLMEEIHWIRVQDNKLMHCAIPTKRILARTGKE